MSTTDEKPDANARVKGKGKIRLGTLLRLEQTAAAPATGGFRFNATRPTDGSIAAVDATLTAPSAGALPAERLAWQLVDTQEEVFLEDNALTTSYGIFGAPRAGKTHLLMYLMGQLVALRSDKPDKKFGGIVLDPKSALVVDVQDMVRAAGREADLVVLNNDELEVHDQEVNIIDCGLDPWELGRSLVLAAQSAGVGASEPFWFVAWSNLFGAALYLLSQGTEELNLALLVDSVLNVEKSEDGEERVIQRIARTAKEKAATLSPEIQADTKHAVTQIEGFYRQEPESIATVETMITRAYGAFQLSKWRRYTPRKLKEAERPTPFYDRIIDDGALVLVSVSPGDPSMAKTICTLVKCLFQQSVLSRLARVRAGTLKNFERPVLLACDEYSDVASEVPGEPMGDGYFFSLARQNGCMGLVVTQSVNMLQASSLKDSWRAIFSNFGAKIFMRLADNETAEEAQKLVGESDWYVTSLGSSREKEGMSSSSTKDLRERKSLPTAVLTQVIGRRQAVLVGTLDGGESQPGTYFISVPDDD